MNRVLVHAERKDAWKGDFNVAVLGALTRQDRPWGLIGAMSQTDLNALAHGDQKIAYGLAYPAYMRLMDELDNPQLRVDLAMAAFLQNRA